MHYSYSALKIGRPQFYFLTYYYQFPLFSLPYQNYLITKMKSKFLQLLLIFTLYALIASKTCSSNQYYASDGSCVDCPANCSTCSTAQFCTDCLPNFYLVSFDFNSTCQTCNQIFVGCKTCLSNLACSVCKDGYFMGGARCNLCSTKNLFCATCSANGQVCTQCFYPYVLVNGLCASPTVPPSSSDSSNSNNNSNDSSSNSSNPSSTVSTNDNLITLANGTKVAPILDSNGCNQIQFLFQGKCISKIPNCYIYQTNGLCSLCSEGYLVTILGECSVKNSILSCEKGYWLDKANDKCVKVKEACDYYYPNNGSCVNCTAGYTLSNNECVQGIKCNSRQFFLLGVCVNVPAQCITFSAVDGACTTCASDYNLNGGLCVKSNVAIFGQTPCTFPCKTCHFANLKFCFSCMPKWSLSNSRYGSCVPVPS